MCYCGRERDEGPLISLVVGIAWNVWLMVAVIHGKPTPYNWPGFKVHTGCHFTVLDNNTLSDAALCYRRTK